MIEDFFKSFFVACRKCLVYFCLVYLEQKTILKKVEFDGLIFPKQQKQNEFLFWFSIYSNTIDHLNCISVFITSPQFFGHFKIKVLEVFSSVIT